MKSILFFVCFGQTRTYIQVKCLQMSLVLFLKLKEVLRYEVERIDQILIFHIVIRFCVNIAKDSQSLFIFRQSLPILFCFEETVSFLSQPLTQIHLNHIMLLSNHLIFLRKVKPRLEVIWQRLIILSLILELTLLELSSFSEQFLKFFH